MHRWVVVAVLAGSLGLAAGCGEAADKDGSPGSGVPVSITRTGGFAGVNQTIEVTGGGEWTYTDRKRTPEQGTLTPEQLSMLQQLVADPDFAAQLGGEATESEAPKQCADTFQYEVRVGALSGVYDDCDADSRQAVVAVIAAVVEATPL